MGIFGAQDGGASLKDKFGLTRIVKRNPDFDGAILRTGDDFIGGEIGPINCVDLHVMSGDVDDWHAFLA